MISQTMEDTAVVWRVWTAINNPNLPHEKWLGTFIELRNDGSAWTVHITANGYNEFECMPKISEEHL